MTKQGVSPGSRLEWIAFCLLDWVLARVPMGVCASVGRFLGGVFHGLSPRYRRLVARNLRIATANDPPGAERIAALVKETFRNTGANFLVSMKAALIPPHQLAEHFEGEELLLLREYPQGLLATTPHMGVWEALPAMAYLVLERGTYGAIYRPLDNPLVDGLIRGHREAAGARMFSRKDGFHAPAAFLRHGGILAVLADQRAGAHGVPMAFLGKITTVSPLPELLARRSKSRVCTLHTEALGETRWKPVLTLVPEPSDTQQIATAMENLIRTHLTQVFWFHDRWRVDATNPLSLYTPLRPEVAGTASVPLRLLLTLPGKVAAGEARAFAEALWALRPDARIELLGRHDALEADARVVCHEWDREAPPEHAEAVLRAVDLAHAAPLDAALLLGSEVALAWACRRMQLRGIIGVEVDGKPWSRSLPRPKSEGDWALLPAKLAWVPSRKSS